MNIKKLEKNFNEMMKNVSLDQMLKIFEAMGGGVEDIFDIEVTGWKVYTPELIKKVFDGANLKFPCKGIIIEKSQCNPIVKFPKTKFNFLLESFEYNMIEKTKNKIPQFYQNLTLVGNEFMEWLEKNTWKIITIRNFDHSDIWIHESGEILHSDFDKSFFVGEFANLDFLSVGDYLELWNHSRKEWTAYSSYRIAAIK